jgi:hypothetical protein
MINNGLKQLMPFSQILKCHKHVLTTVGRLLRKHLIINKVTNSPLANY